MLVERDIKRMTLKIEITEQELVEMRRKDTLLHPLDNGYFLIIMVRKHGEIHNEVRSS